jgi:hypothetical protein
MVRHHCMQLSPPGPPQDAPRTADHRKTRSENRGPLQHAYMHAKGWLYKILTSFQSTTTPEARSWRRIARWWLFASDAWTRTATLSMPIEIDIYTDVA